MITLSYLKQVDVCESVREMIKRALVQSDDVRVKLKANTIPATDSILRTVSSSPDVDTEERMKDHIKQHILGSLHLTDIQSERLHSLL